MKTRLIILLLLAVCSSCGTNNKPVSDVQKEKIQVEVKEVLNTFITGCEEANFEKASAVWLDSPDFVFLLNGRTYSYKEVMEMKSAFDALLNQKCTIADEKFLVLDNSTVIYTANSRWEVNYKDGHSTIEDPEAIMIFFRKTDGIWKAAYLVDSFIEKTVKYAEPSKEINQVELFKKFTGLWVGNNGKDTVFTWEARPFGTGLECNYKTIVKGKTVSEGKQLFGYDKKTDKYIVATLVKGMDQELGAVWFVSNDKFIVTNYDQMSTPDQASMRVDGVFKSPTVYVENVTLNGKPAGSYTYTRSQ
jgi:hypothetical protein